MANMLIARKACVRGERRYQCAHSPVKGGVLEWELLSYSLHNFKIPEAMQPCIFLCIGLHAEVRIHRCHFAAVLQEIVLL